MEMEILSAAFFVRGKVMWAGALTFVRLMYQVGKACLSFDKRSSQGQSGKEGSVSVSRNALNQSCPIDYVTPTK